MTGKVFLVGAGPGDVGLLTKKGENLIKQADVIVCDRLVSDDIISLKNKKTKFIDVGKTAGEHPVPQERISEIIAEEAQKGNLVVRLKGGDPFIFGRGGEELELLAENDIPFEVVPGITSSIAAPAYAGIPATHRDFCSSVHIITGHAKAGSEVSIDFDALVKLNGTLIFMMSVASIPKISKGLLEAGMSEDMTCAVIENGTRTYQRKFVDSLACIADVVKRENIISPAVIMVGKVCSLADKFEWFDCLPLKGRKILVTQPSSKPSKLNDGMKRLGADTKLYPCVTTSMKRPISPPFKEYDVLIFTSMEGVKSFLDWLLEEDFDMRDLAGKSIAVVGKSTERTLNEYGLKADFVPTVFSGKTLVEEGVEKNFLDDKKSVLLLRTDRGDDEILKALSKYKIKFEDYPVYETRIIANDDRIDIDDFELVAFTSRSAVEGLSKSTGIDNFKGKRALCVGRITANAAKDRGFSVIVSKKATIDSMIEKAIEIFSEEMID